MTAATKACIHKSTVNTALLHESLLEAIKVGATALWTPRCMCMREYMVRADEATAYVTASSGSLWFYGLFETASARLQLEVLKVASLNSCLGAPEWYLE
eukprot:825761-Pelagomonas_calceolata.AAC.1